MSAINWISTISSASCERAKICAQRSRHTSCKEIHIMLTHIAWADLSQQKTFTSSTSRRTRSQTFSSSTLSRSISVSESITLESRWRTSLKRPNIIASHSTMTSTSLGALQVVSLTEVVRCHVTFVVEMLVPVSIMCSIIIIIIRRIIKSKGEFVCKRIE